MEKFYKRVLLHANDAHLLSDEPDLLLEASNRLGNTVSVNLRVIMDKMKVMISNREGTNRSCG